MDLFILLGIPLTIMLLWAILSYNSLVHSRNLMRRALSSIDIQLSKRHQLIPDLVETCKAYSLHEEKSLVALARTRARAHESHQNHQPPSSPHALSPPSHDALDTSRNLQTLFARSESYPELKADKQYLNLQKNLTEIEEQLAASRRSYNAAVQQHNNLVESFPSRLIASGTGFGIAGYWED